MDKKINGMSADPVDSEVKEKHIAFKDEVTRLALDSLRERIPRKILHFNNLVKANATAGGLFNSRDLDSVSYRVSAIEDASGKRQKRAVETSTEDGPVITPSHKQILDQLEVIKSEASELIEIIGNIKLWIQLNVPRIEDGNNFGVGIQEEVILELTRVEDMAFNLFDSIVKYYMARAKLCTKVIKYPNVCDYSEAIRELDEKEWIHIKISTVDMRNNYSMIYDLLCKVARVTGDSPRAELGEGRQAQEREQPLPHDVLAALKQLDVLLGQAELIDQLRVGVVARAYLDGDDAVGYRNGAGELAAQRLGHGRLVDVEEVVEQPLDGGDVLAVAARLDGDRDWLRGALADGRGVLAPQDLVVLGGVVDVLHNDIAVVADVLGDELLELLQGQRFLVHRQPASRQVLALRGRKGQQTLHLDLVAPRPLALLHLRQGDRLELDEGLASAVDVHHSGRATGLLHGDEPLLGPGLEELGQFLAGRVLVRDEGGCVLRRDVVVPHAGLLQQSPERRRGQQAGAVGRHLPVERADLHRELCVGNAVDGLQEADANDVVYQRHGEDHRCRFRTTRSSWCRNLEGFHPLHDCSNAATISTSAVLFVACFGQVLNLARFGGAGGLLIRFNGARRFGRGDGSSRVSFRYVAGSGLMATRRSA
ncbi:subunit of proteaseome activator complex, putative [Babesia caballi]|uniref:Subunit of proteaseome activator complex, putative n=1 Tax=Babesia caballi TaxID=5871 RepID=A0AAV4LTT7_BABCB|nr:subunit of proteaseome activator complex, putative [Babesia caballi]